MLAQASYAVKVICDIVRELPLLGNYQYSAVVPEELPEDQWIAWLIDRFKKGDLKKPTTEELHGPDPDYE
jgi:hypothetical protein